MTPDTSEAEVATAGTEYYAHKERTASDDPTSGRWQKLITHLLAVASLCGAYAKVFGAETLGYIAGLLHDIGKYSDKWQRYLLGKGAKQDDHDHLSLGAYVAASENELLYVAECIASHHRGLVPLGCIDDLPDAKTLWGRVNKAKQEVAKTCSTWKTEVLMLMPAKQKITEAVRVLKETAITKIEEYFLVLMLYSCLVDADWTDTADFMRGKQLKPQYSTIDELISRLDAYTAKWDNPNNLKSIINQLRSAILNEMKEKGKKLPPGLYTLTVPTGGGKTVCAIEFALRSASRNNQSGVIVVIPYISITEQTADEYRRIFGAENVLEHHSSAAWRNRSSSGRQNSDGDYNDPDYLVIQNASENWDMPIIVTTAVQFFTSIYSADPAPCRKVHNIVNHVVIFDEAQMMPVENLAPCVCAISELVKHYKVTAVLCSATQPSLNGLFEQYYGKAPVELCPPELSANSAWDRVTYRNIGKIGWREVAEQLNEQEQVLCIVNSRLDAKLLYSKLGKEGRFHLSTTMTPAHRVAVLAAIRTRLKMGLVCRVVSTSLIECGVDISFRSVWRALAGLDSIIQAAGRCNRNGDYPPEESIVTIFEPKGPPRNRQSPIATNIGCARAVLADYHEPSARAVEEYFYQIVNMRSFQVKGLDKGNVLGLINKGGFPHRAVAEAFHFIDDDMRTLYIPDDTNADLMADLRSEDCPRSSRRRAGTYGASVSQSYLEKLVEAGSAELLPDGVSAVLTNPELYDASTGLILEREQADGEVSAA